MACGAHPRGGRLPIRTSIPAVPKASRLSHPGHPGIAFAMRSALAASLVAVQFALLPAAASAQALALAPDDTVENVLAAHKGKRVTVKLGPGDELTGVVKLVTPQVVHLSEIAGRELFDAVVDTRRVVAVLVRTR